MKLDHIKDGQRIANNKHPFYFSLLVFLVVIGITILTNQGILFLHIILVATLAYSLITMATRTLPLGILFYSNSTVAKGNRVIFYSLFFILFLFMIVGTLGFDKIVISKLLISLPISIAFAVLLFKYQLGQI